MDGTFDELLVLAAKQVNGRQKRIFIAAVCEKLCDGSARKSQERFGWGREAIAKGLLERSSEPEEEVRLPRGGVKPSEVRNPQDDPTTLEISVDTKSKVSLGEYVLGGKNPNRQPR